MKALRNLLDQIEPFVRKGEPLEKLYPQYEALDTFLFTPGLVTKGPTHLRDSIDHQFAQVLIRIEGVQLDLKLSLLAIS